MPTSLTGTPTKPLCADFVLSPDGHSVVLCPNGCEPFKQIYHEDTREIDAKFSHNNCDECPYRQNCPGVDQKKAVKVTISANMVARAELQKSLGDEEHKQMARERNAVEAIPSVFRRKYVIDHIRSFISPRIRSAFFAICLAFNGQKHQKFLNNHRVKCALL